VLHILLILATFQQTPSSAIADFRSIRTFPCDFGGGGGHVFDERGGDTDGARVITSPPYMYDDARGLIIDSIDYRTLRARSVTKDSPVTVTVIPGDRLVSFLEVAPDGVPIVTSILRAPRPLEPPSQQYVPCRSLLSVADYGNRRQILSAGWSLQGPSVAGRAFGKR
jgi:hypothetical protein